MSREVIIAAGPTTWPIRPAIAGFASSCSRTSISMTDGAAEVVDEHDVRAAAGHEGRELLRDHGDGAAGVEVVDLLDAGLAVDAEAELGLALRDAVLLGRAGHGAGVERHADRARAGDDALGRGGDGGEVGAGLGQGAGDLVDEERAGDAARPVGCRAARCRRRR